MLHFVSAYWYIGLAGLLVPVLIHLWNKKQPQVVKVGSIRWLQAAASPQARRPQLRDWPLLLLRCLLLALLALFLGQPHWQQYLRAGAKRYLWVSPTLLQPHTLPLVQDAIDSLLQQHYELRQFAPGFRLISGDAWASLKTGTRGNQVPGPDYDYWSLARALPGQFPQARDHVIFTDNALSRFAGPRPVLPAATRWLPIAVNRPDSLFVQEVWQRGPDSLTVTLGHSRSAGTHFTSLPLAISRMGELQAPAGFPPLVYSRQGTGAFLGFRDKAERVPVKKTSPELTIYYDKSRAGDVRYLTAALAALRDYAGRPLRIRHTTSWTPAAAPAGWLFWLSDQPLPGGLQARQAAGLVVFRDAAGTGKTAAGGWLNSARVPEKVLLSRQAPLSEKEGSSWLNNFGEPLLHYQALGQGGLYTFASRFNSQWSQLPESSFFPEMLGDLLWPEPGSRHDAREIAAGQVQPGISKGRARPLPMRQQQDLKYGLLALATFLFLTERLWAHQKKNRIA